MSADLLRPWIDLLTWQVLALLGGLAILPAIYIFVLRIGSATIGGANFQLSRKDVDKIEEEVEESTEESTPQLALAELNAAPSEEPIDVRDKLAAALTTWRNLQIVVKARAHHVGGPEDLRAVIRNLTELAGKFPKAVSTNDIRRAEDLKEELSRFKDQPTQLTASALKAFRRRVGSLARKVEEIPIEITPVLSIV